MAAIGDRYQCVNMNKQRSDERLTILGFHQGSLILKLGAKQEEQYFSLLHIVQLDSGGLCQALTGLLLNFNFRVLEGLC